MPTFLEDQPAPACPAEARSARALERLAARADADAWALLVDLHGPAVAAICRGICGPGGLADDACQETWLLLARVAHRYRRAVRAEDDEALAAAWIRRIAANVALTLLRRNRRAAKR